MKHAATYFLGVILLFFLSNDSKGQGCVDSVRLYGFTSPDYTFRHGNNISCRLENGKSVYGMGRSQIPDLRKSEALCIIDSTGKVIAARSLELAGQQKFGLLGLAYTGKSHLYALGASIRTFAGTEHYTAAMIICLDTSLNVIWSKTLQANIDPANDGEYSVTGITTDTSGNVFCSFYNDKDFSLIRKPVVFASLSPAGDLRWSKAIPAAMIWNSQSIPVQFFPDAFSVGDKVYFLGQSQTDTTINGQRVVRYGFTGLSFSSGNGALVKASRSFLPNEQPNIGEFGIPAFSAQSYFGDKYSYAFGEYVQRNFADSGELNTVTFNTDTNFLVTGVIRIKGMTSAYGFPRFSFNQKGDVAVVSTTSYNTVSVFNSRGQLLLNRKIGTGILTQPFIRSMRFLDNQDYLRLTVIDIGRPAFDMLIVDLPVTGDNEIFSCLGEQGILLEKDTVDVETRALTLPTIDNVVTVGQLVVQTSDIVLQEIEFCEVKSDCNQLTVNAEAKACVGKEWIVEAQKNTGCSRQLLWALSDVPATRRATTDSSMTLVFDRAWSGYIKVSLLGCELSDSVFVEVKEGNVRPDLGRDQLWCGNNFNLSPGNSFLSYQWQDGSADEQFMVTAPGKYFVTVTDYCGQSFSDTVNVYIDKVKLLTSSDTILCRQQEIRLTAKTGFSDYKWEPEYRLRNILENEVMVSPEVDTKYVITVNAGQGCTISDTILLKVVDCTAGLYVPSAFTPNGDGKNDRLIPVVRGQILQYEFSVYNRVGQLVFRTKSLGEGWSGFKGNTLQSADVYVWMCRVQWVNGGVELKKGSFVLIR